MRKLFPTLALTLALMPSPPILLGQTPAAGEADPGVRPTRMIDRAEVRVSRVEIQAGATRRVHAHDDVVYHLWVPLEGTLQITIGSAAPVTATSGQAFFMTRGTQHGFNNDTTPRYDAKASELAWKRTIAFFNKRLR